MAFIRVTQAGAEYAISSAAPNARATQIGADVAIGFGQYTMLREGYGQAVRIGSNNGATPNTGPVTTHTWTERTIDVKKGDRIVLMSSQYGVTTISTITDSAGFTWTRHAQGTSVNGGQTHPEIWSAPATAAVTDLTFTVTFTGSSYATFQTFVFNINGGPGEVGAATLASSGTGTPSITASGNTKFKDSITLTATAVVGGGGNAPITDLNEPAGWWHLGQYPDYTNTAAVYAAARVTTAVETPVWSHTGQTSGPWSTIMLSFGAPRKPVLNVHLI
jgi:hypothetical protein